MIERYYFGCRESAGHYFWRPDGSKPRGEVSPWGNSCDGGLQYKNDGQRQTDPSYQTEGLALIHHKDGWTALAFWDRSVDRRYACNSTFLINEILDFAAMTAMAKDHFPWVWNRYKFDVVEIRET